MNYSWFGHFSLTFFIIIRVVCGVADTNFLGWLLKGDFLSNFTLFVVVTHWFPLEIEYRRDIKGLDANRDDCHDDICLSVTNEQMRLPRLKCQSIFGLIFLSCFTCAEMSENKWRRGNDKWKGGRGCFHHTVATFRYHPEKSLKKGCHIRKWIFFHRNALFDQNFHLPRSIEMF